MAATNGAAELTVAEAKEEEEATHDGGGHTQWLRAAVLGANDGLVSTAALMLGIGAARPADARAVLLSGLAGLVAGACSMAIGEYVSVHAQLDLELADLELRAAVLGANDGLVSTAALMLGIGAARPADARAVLLSGLAGLVAGACSMAIGEYVSVHAQLDLELADLERRRRRGAPAPAGLRLQAVSRPRPGQAAAASALSFAAGAAFPLLAAWFVASYRVRVVVVVATASLALAAFGAAGAQLGRAPGGRAGLRAVVGGLVAMAATYGVMKLFRTHGV